MLLPISMTRSDLDLQSLIVYTGNAETQPHTHICLVVTAVQTTEAWFFLKKGHKLHFRSYNIHSVAADLKAKAHSIQKPTEV